jgi:hypothetical protein
MQVQVAKSYPWVRFMLLTGIFGAILFIVINLLTYPDIITMYPATSLILLTFFALLMAGYIWFAIHFTYTKDESWRSVLRHGLWAGAVIGGLWIIEITIGNLVNPPPGIIEFVVHSLYRLCILAIPLVTVLAAARISKKTGQFSSGVWVGLWSGILSALMVFGMFVLVGLFFSARPDPQTMAAFARSGFTDYAAFNRSDTLVAMINHLWIGPCIGILFGAIGGVFRRVSL